MAISDLLVSILGRIPGWDPADLKIERLKEGTSLNYLIERQGERFVLRIRGPHAPPLGINRQHEYAATVLAASVGVAPEVIHFVKPEGHLVTRFIDGREWSADEFRDSQILGRIARTLRTIHRLRPLHVPFSPIRTAESYIETALRLGIAPPADWERLRARMMEIGGAERGDPPKPCPCHNHLVEHHFLDDGTVRVLDWAYAGMGNPYFDLAAVMMSPALTAEANHDRLERDLLEAYFGEVTSRHHERLRRMKAMWLLVSATRAMVQEGASAAHGHLRPWIESEFTRLRQLLAEGDAC